MKQEPISSGHVAQCTRYHWTMKFFWAFRVQSLSSFQSSHPNLLTRAASSPSVVLFPLPVVSLLQTIVRPTTFLEFNICVRQRDSRGKIDIRVFCYLLETLLSLVRPLDVGRSMFTIALGCWHLDILLPFDPAPNDNCNPRVTRYRSLFRCLYDSMLTLPCAPIVLC